MRSVMGPALGSAGVFTLLGLSSKLVDDPDVDGDSDMLLIGAGSGVLFVLMCLAFRADRKRRAQRLAKVLQPRASYSFKEAYSKLNHPHGTSKH